MQEQGRGSRTVRDARSAASGVGVACIALAVMAAPLAGQGRARQQVTADYSAPAGAPYVAEQVTVPTSRGYTLAGTLTLPKGARAAHRVAAIVTITGSGPEDRDEFIGIKNYRPFRQIADSLGRRGIAVLRMDDRGTGASGGSFKGSTSADFAEDIQSGLAYLRTRPEIDASRLGLLGHSEGGLIAPMVALKEPSLRGIVLMAGPSETGREILQYQLSNNINHSPKLVGAQRDAALAGVSHMIDSMGTADAWMGFFIDHDPLATARQVKTPVLILNGATDQQVTPNQVAQLEAAFKAAGNTDVTAHIFPNLNHLFVHDTSGFPGGYAKLPQPVKVQSDVVGTVADWLAVHLK